MPQLFANNATTTLSLAVLAGDLTLVVADASAFPSPSSGDFSILTLTQINAETSWEEVLLTARAGNTLTVVRAHEGVAQGWSAGDKVELRITAKYLNQVGYINIPQIISSADHTLVLQDQGRQILHPSADTAARTFTIPANSAVPFPIGTAVTFINQNGAGVVSVAITSDTMRLAGAATTGTRALAANGVATAIKVTATEWIISGVGLT